VESERGSEEECAPLSAAEEEAGAGVLEEKINCWKI
jgi:hypothetical protein